MTADAVRNTSEGAGRAVVACAVGAEAMRVLGGGGPFDLVIACVLLRESDFAQEVGEARV